MEERPATPLGRQVGGRLTGMLKRGTTRVVSTRAHSSIPSKYETIINVGPKAKDGFSSRTTRFVETENDLPGPGNYHVEGTLETQSDSIGRKGYGSGFVSKDRRFPEGARFVGPGPGAYHDPAKATIVSKTFNRAPTSAVFAKKSENVGPPLEPKVAKRSSPGPGEYNPSSIGSERTVYSNFRSRSSRFGAGPSASRTVPAPGSYNVNEIDTSFRTQPGDHPTAAFLDTAGRSQVEPGARTMVVGAPNIIYGDEEDTQALVTSPGPGQYEYDQGNVGSRLAERQAGKTSSMFSRMQVDRFGVPIEPRVNRGCVPGPGAYEAPGTIGTRGVSGASAFVSTTGREIDRIMTVGALNKPPGPAFYNPIHVDKKSFHLNGRKLWM